MKIGVTSQSKLKLDAVIEAYSFMDEKPDIVRYRADSGVGEQPVGHEALIGASNRVSDLLKRESKLDRIISIENGIFNENGVWKDKAVVLIYDVNSDNEHAEFSDEVVFPTKFVNEACELGFDKVTVGEVMERHNYIKNSKDLHLCISGVPRKFFIEDLVIGLVRKFESYDSRK